MTNREKRCADCICLVKKNGMMCCDEMWGQPCNELEECPEGVELDEIETLNEKAKDVKLTNQAEKPKTEKTEKKTKVSEEKTRIFNTILDVLNEKYTTDVIIDNKKLGITLNGKHFTVDLVENRPKK